MGDTLGKILGWPPELSLPDPWEKFSDDTSSFLGRVALYMGFVGFIAVIVAGWRKATSVYDILQFLGILSVVGLVFVTLAYFDHKDGGGKNEERKKYYICRDCGREFDSRRGVSVHETRVHENED